LELQHRLVRQTINIAVSKAMGDMKSNAKRSIRNLIDLGLLFSKSENQKQFFTAAQKVITHPGNPYHSLVTRMISDVNNDTIKKVAVNLGYSLIYGANKLKKRQDYLRVPVPWLLIFVISESGSAFFPQMEYFVREGRELGIYSYITCPHEKDHIPAICEIAKRFEDCLFVLKVPSGLISGQTAETLGKIHNAMIAVEVADMDFSCESDVNAFRLLKESRCLYGFHVSYNEENMTQVIGPEYIRSAISLGNLFGVYAAEHGVSDTFRDAVYAFVCRERGENGQPLITLEWLRDMRYIGEEILSGDGYVAINLAEKAYDEYKKVKDTLTNSLLEILQIMRPGTRHVLEPQ
jgi:hypothetical protein